MAPNRNHEQQQQPAQESKKAGGRAGQVLHSLTVGAILAASWGYEQTNVSFYEVVALNGPSMVTLRRIESKRVSYDHMGMGGKVVPMPGAYYPDASIRRKVKMGSYSTFVKIDDSEYAQPWNGEPCSFTSYA